MNWPHTWSENLKHVVEAFQNRSKTINYQGAVEARSTFEDQEKKENESLEIEFTPTNREQLMTINIFEDFEIDLTIVSGRTKDFGKKLLEIERMKIPHDPILIVETFVSTIKGIPSRNIGEIKTEWKKLERWNY